MQPDKAGRVECGPLGLPRHGGSRKVPQGQNLTYYESQLNYHPTGYTSMSQQPVAVQSQSHIPAGQAARPPGPPVHNQIGTAAPGQATYMYALQTDRFQGQNASLYGAQYYDTVPPEDLLPLQRLMRPGQDGQPLVAGRVAARLNPYLPRQGIALSNQQVPTVGTYTTPDQVPALPLQPTSSPPAALPGPQVQSPPDAMVPPPQGQHQQEKHGMITHQALQNGPVQRTTTGEQALGMRHPCDPPVGGQQAGPSPNLEPTHEPLDLLRTRNWLEEAKQVFHLTNKTYDYYRNKLIDSENGLTPTEQLELTIATEKQALAQLDLQAAKLALRAGEMSQQLWSLAPAPNYGLRLPPVDIKRHLEEGKLQPKCPLYPMNADVCTSGAPIPADQIVASLEQLLREAHEARERSQAKAASDAHNGRAVGVGKQRRLGAPPAADLNVAEECEREASSNVAGVEVGKGEDFDEVAGTRAEEHPLQRTALHPLPPASASVPPVISPRGMQRQQFRRPNQIFGQFGAQYMHQAAPSPGTFGAAAPPLPQVPVRRPSPHPPSPALQPQPQQHHHHHNYHHSLAALHKEWTAPSPLCLRDDIMASIPFSNNAPQFGGGSSNPALHDQVDLSEFLPSMEETIAPPAGLEPNQAPTATRGLSLLQLPTVFDSVDPKLAEAMKGIMTPDDLIAKRRSMGLCPKDLRCVLHANHTTRCKHAVDEIEALKQAEMIAQMAPHRATGEAAAPQWGGGRGGRSSRRGRRPKNSLGQTAMPLNHQKSSPLPRALLPNCFCGRPCVLEHAANGNSGMVLVCPKRQGGGGGCDTMIPAPPPPLDTDVDEETDTEDEDALNPDHNRGKRQRRPSSRLNTELYDLGGRQTRGQDDDNDCQGHDNDGTDDGKERDAKDGGGGEVAPDAHKTSERAVLSAPQIAAQGTIHQNESPQRRQVVTKDRPPLGIHGCWRNATCRKPYGHVGKCMLESSKSTSGLPPLMLAPAEATAAAPAAAPPHNGEPASLPHGTAAAAGTGAQHPLTRSDDASNGSTRPPVPDQILQKGAARPSQVTPRSPQEEASPTQIEDDVLEGGLQEGRINNNDGDGELNNLRPLREASMPASPVRQELDQLGPQPLAGTAASIEAKPVANAGIVDAQPAPRIPAAPAPPLPAVIVAIKPADGAASADHMNIEPSATLIEKDSLQRGAPAAGTGTAAGAGTGAMVSPPEAIVVSLSATGGTTCTEEVSRDTDGGSNISAGEGTGASDSPSDVRPPVHWGERRVRSYLPVTLPARDKEHNQEITMGSTGDVAAGMGRGGGGGGGTAHDNFNGSTMRGIGRGGAGRGRGRGARGRLRGGRGRRRGNLYRTLLERNGGKGPTGLRRAGVDVPVQEVRLCRKAEWCQLSAGHLGYCSPKFVAVAEGDTTAPATDDNPRRSHHEQCLRNASCINSAGHRGACSIDKSHVVASVADSPGPAKGIAKGIVAVGAGRSRTQSPPPASNNEPAHPLNSPEVTEEENSATDSAIPSDGEAAAFEPCPRYSWCLNPRNHRGRCRKHHHKKTPGRRLKRQNWDSSHREQNKKKGKKRERNGEELQKQQLGKGDSGEDSEDRGGGPRAAKRFRQNAEMDGNIKCDSNVTLHASLDSDTILAEAVVGGCAVGVADKTKAVSRDPPRATKLLKPRLLGKDTADEISGYGVMYPPFNDLGRPTRSLQELHTIDMPGVWVDYLQESLKRTEHKTFKPLPPTQQPAARKTRPFQLMYAEFVAAFAEKTAAYFSSARGVPYSQWKVSKREFERQCELLAASPPPSGAPTGGGPLSPLSNSLQSRSRRQKLPSLDDEPYGPEEWVRVQLKANRVVFRKAPSTVHGHGIFAIEDIAAGSFVTEYIGEVINNEEADRREAQYQEAAKGRALFSAGAASAQGPSLSPRRRPTAGDCYMFRLDADWVVDATQAGSLARFINHCCDPNCCTRIVVDGLGRRHICIYAKKDISAGSEISYDYCFQEDPALPALPCNCGAATCTGRMDRPGGVTSTAGTA